MAGFRTVNKFPQLGAGLKTVIANAVKQGAIIVQTNAMQNAPFDTGFLESSIYHEFFDGSDYGKHFSTPLKGNGYLLPEVEKPPDKYTAYVAVGANYGIYVELGTRKMAAQPYFYPAIEAAIPEFQALLDTIEVPLAGTIT